MIDYLRHFTTTPEGKILYVLAIIACLMIIDFISGTIAAIINPNIDFKSSAGRNGILKRVGAILTLLILIPIGIIIPGDVGIMLVYTLYVGYLLLELKSIIENLDKMGVNVGPFKIFLNNFEQFVNNKKNQ